MQQFKHYFAHMLINFKNEILACACLDTSGIASLARQAHASKQLLSCFGGENAQTASKMRGWQG